MSLIEVHYFFPSNFLVYASVVVSWQGKKFNAILFDLISCLIFVFAGEVVEQLHLLQDLAPDWISERTASTGDFLYR
jgi:hypothetical protein